MGGFEFVGDVAGRGALFAFPRGDPGAEPAFGHGFLVGADVGQVQGGVRGPEQGVFLRQPGRGAAPSGSVSSVWSTSSR